MRILSGITVFTCVYFLCHEVSCQCTFGTTFASTTWHDNTKGTLTFTTTGMSGWAFTSTRTSGSSTISSWQCVNHTSDSYLVLRTTNTFAFQASSSTTSLQVYAYLCLELTSVTTDSFMYYQPQVQEINLGGERLKVSTSSTLYQDDVCDSTVSVPTTEYHVLVKSGSEENAAIQCPNSLLFIADFTYYGSDGSTSCTGSGDRWDVCTNKTQMSITTSSCTQEIAFSADGQFYCVATLSSNGYDYTTVYNRDDSITVTTNRFACMSSRGSDVSVAPGNCTAYQTPYSFPLEADQLTTTGHRLVITKKYENCGPSSGLSVGEIVAIVISVLFIIYVWTMMIIFSILVIIIALVFFGLAIACIGEFTSYGDHIPRQKPSVPLKLDMSDVDKEKLAALEEAGETVSPSKVILNGKANGKLNVEKETSGVHGLKNIKGKEASKVNSPRRKKDS